MNKGVNNIPIAYKKFCIVASSQTQGNTGYGKADFWITHNLTTITLNKYDPCIGEYIVIGI